VTHDQEEALSLADRLVVHRDGVVQQVGTPEDLYRSPANSYVAGFMGYRNLLAVDVVAGAGDGLEAGSGRQVSCRVGELELVGTAREPVDGRQAILAIRPEDFVVGDAGDNPLRVQVEVVEYHGREHAVQARLPGGQVVRLRTEARVRPGDTVTACVPRDKALVFAADPDDAAVAAAAAGADVDGWMAGADSVSSGFGSAGRPLPGTGGADQAPGTEDGPPAGVVAGPPAGVAGNTPKASQ